jgi:hypothetical protein
MALLGFELLLRLLWGSALGVVFVRRTESSEKFVKIAARFVWGIGLSAVLLLLSSGGAHVKQLLGAGLLILGFELYSRIVARWGRITGFALILLSPLCLLWGLGWQDYVNWVSSGILLGGFFAGQFLGHWFLNVPGMHIQELKRVTQYLFVGLFLKTAEVVVSLFLRWDQFQAEGLDAMGRPLGIDLSAPEVLLKLNPSQSIFALEGEGFMGLGSYGFVLLAMRLMWGLIAPWILALMIRETVRTRSTQSATGIYYAACVMILVGEATALYLRNVLKFYL